MLLLRRKKGGSYWLQIAVLTGNTDYVEKVIANGKELTVIDYIHKIRYSIRFVDRIYGFSFRLDCSGLYFAVYNA